MKNLIKKILRESDDWDWVRDIVSDERITKDNVEVGMRVRMNPDSQFVRQTKTNGHGTVSHINDDDFPEIDGDVETYWVYVNWDDGERNSYRVGDVEFDLLFPNEKPPIKESDEFDWIRTTDINPWVEYDGIHFDIEPSEGDVFKYIEMALNSFDVLNSDFWESPHKDDINSIIEYFRNNKIVYLIMDNKGRLSYGTTLRHWIDGSEFNLIKYSQLNDGDTITESDELDWIKDIEPTKIENNTKYKVKYEDLYDFLTKVEEEQPTFRWVSNTKPTEFKVPYRYVKTHPNYVKIVIRNGRLTYNMGGQQLVGQQPIDFSDTINWP